MPAKKRYISKRDCLNTGDRQYGFNEPCEFTEDEARSLLALRAIEPAEPVEEGSAGASTSTSTSTSADGAGGAGQVPGGGGGGGQGQGAGTAEAKAVVKAPATGAAKRSAKKPAKG